MVIKKLWANLPQVCQKSLISPRNKRTIFLICELSSLVLCRLCLLRYLWKEMSNFLSVLEKGCKCLLVFIQRFAPLQRKINLHVISLLNTFLLADFLSSKFFSTTPWKIIVKIEQVLSVHWIWYIFVAILPLYKVHWL